MDEKQINENKGSLQAKKDSQARDWCFTVNNPVQAEAQFCEYLKSIVNVRYFCFGREKGDGTDDNPTGTEHYQGYIEFSMPKRFSTVKGYFSEAAIGVNANIQSRAGKRGEARDYVFKTGKYADKAHTRMGEVYTHGEFIEDGERADLGCIADDIEGGMTNMELSRKYGNKYVTVRGWADEYRQDFLAQKYSKERRLDLEVIYIFGKTDIGKTRYILDKYGDENVFIMSEYGNNFTKERFDGYKGERIVLFEEFRSSIVISNMLRYLDVYKVQLPCRYNNKIACYNKAYITSNWELLEQYKNIQAEHPETWKAFLRRIHKVYDFDKSKDIAVDSYTWYPFKGIVPKQQKIAVSGLRPLSDAEQEELGF